MRLFVAIELTDEARAAVAAEQRRVCEALGGEASLRLVKSEHMHLTLAFIGDTTDDSAEAIGAAIAADIPAAAFRLAFGGLGVFPGRGAPRVLWLGVVDGEQHAVHLHDMVAARIAAAGVALERRPFRPHLTIARWREASSHAARRFNTPVGAAGTTVPPDIPVVASVEVEAVTLFQSRLMPAGAIHIPRARGFLRPVDAGALH